AVALAFGEGFTVLRVLAGLLHGLPRLFEPPPLLGDDLLHGGGLLLLRCHVALGHVCLLLPIASESLRIACSFPSRAAPHRKPRSGLLPAPPASETVPAGASRVHIPLQHERDGSSPLPEPRCRGALLAGRLPDAGIADVEAG